MRPLRPPALAALLLGATAPAEERDAQLGDLQEEFEERAGRDPAGARRWYWRQAAGSVAPNLVRRIRRAGTTLTAMGVGEETMQSFWQNVRLALRGARRNLAFSAVIVLTLGLGIGANSTVFSAVYGLVINPFPFPEPDRIVGVGTAYPRIGAELGFWENLSPLEYVDIRDQSRTLEDVVSWDMGNRQIAGEGPPQNVFTGFWWGDALRTLGMDAHLGRGFTDEEVSQGAQVAVLSYSIWRDRFGADSALVGSTISVNGNPHTVVGILPEGVDIHGTDLWTIMGASPEQWPRNRRQFQVMARIAEGSSLQQVNAELQGLARRTEQEHAAEFEEYQGWSIRAATWNNVSSQAFRNVLYIVLGAVGFVLLLICANTANLLLARAQGRRREMAVRTALGAGRGRLVGQMLTESVILASLGGVVGVGVAYLGARALQDVLTRVALPVAGSVAVNGPVLLFTAGVAVAVGIIFGMAPALQGSRADIAGALAAEGKGSTQGASKQRLQRALVGLEVVLAFVLLAGGGLLVNSFVRMAAVDPGFQHEHVLTMRLTLPREEYQGAAVPAFFQELTERLEAVPGIRSAGAGSQFPPISFTYNRIWFDGLEAGPDATLPTALTTVVTPGYFESLGMPLVAGRTLQDGDRAGAPSVVVVNQAAVDRYLGGVNPLGRRFKLGGPDADSEWWEIVGVVGTTRNRGLDQAPYPEIFAPHAQLGGVQNQLFLVLRTEVDPETLVPQVRRTVQEMDPDQPVYAIQTVEEAFAAATTTRRVATGALSLLGLFALILAAVGIYSVVSFTVSERTQEIGLRVALGADEGRVRRLVVRQALLPVAVGAAVGLGLAIPLGMAMEGILFGVGATDPVTMGAVALLLVGVAVVASWMPAWRASRMDPVEALRVE